MTQSLALAPMSFSDQMKASEVLAKADIVPRDYKDKPANILVAAQFGASMGLSPAESLYRINVIQGKPTMSAELVAAQVRAAGHKLRIEKDEQALSVTCTIVRADDPDYPISVTRDAQWARQMGLTSRENYKKQPLTMLTWRAITACAREACSEALYGVAYTPDEMYDIPTHTQQQAPIQAQNVTVEQTPKKKKTASKKASKPVTATAESTADPMQPVRNLFKAYVAARGRTQEEVQQELAGALGIKSMHEHPDELMALKVASQMREYIEKKQAEKEQQQEQQPEQQEINYQIEGVEYADEDIVF